MPNTAKYLEEVHPGEILLEDFLKPMGISARQLATDCYHPLMIDWSTCSVVEHDPKRVSGAWVFLGTRIPVAALFENLEDDASIQEFVEWFPGVTLEQAKQVLEHAARSSLAVA